MGTTGYVVRLHTGERGTGQSLNQRHTLCAISATFEFVASWASTGSSNIMLGQCPILWIGTPTLAVAEARGSRGIRRTGRNEAVEIKANSKEGI
jgi:hypothetical protein